MGYSFLLVSGREDAAWPTFVARALSSLGELRTLEEEVAIAAGAQRGYDVVIIDAGVVADPQQLTQRLRDKWPDTRVVVATQSPTWQRARLALQAGAADYIRKTRNEKELQCRIRSVLDRPAPPLENS